MSLLTNLVAHWKLNEASGTRNDSQGSNNLTDNNTVGSAVGKLDNAAVFVAANGESLTRTDNSDLSLGSDQDFTFGFWFNFTSKTDLQTLFGKAPNGWSTEQLEYLCRYRSGTDDFKFYVGNGISFAQLDIPMSSVSTGTWHYLLLWHDSQENTICSQLDNGTINSTPWSGGTQDTNGFFSIGAVNDIGSPNYFFDGLIDSVSFWKRVLSSAEKEALYNSGNGFDFESFTQWGGTLKDFLISHWKLNETSGTRVDEHGPNDLTDNNTVGSSTGKLGLAAQFVSANSEYLSIADNPDLSVGDINFTISCWVNVTSYSGNTVILQKGWYDAYMQYALFIDASTSKFHFYIADGAGSVMADNAGIVSTGVWYFIVISYDAANDQLSIQVNNGTADTASYSGGNTTTTGAFQIGALGAGNGNYLNGLVDSVSIWKRLLTPTELTSLYNSGNGFDYPFDNSVSILRRRVFII